LLLAVQIIRFCKILPPACNNVLAALMGPSDQINQTRLASSPFAAKPKLMSLPHPRLPFYLSYEPNPTSVRNMIHWYDWNPHQFIRPSQADPIVPAGRNLLPRTPSECMIGAFRATLRSTGKPHRRIMISQRCLLRCRSRFSLEVPCPLPNMESGVCQTLTFSPSLKPTITWPHQLMSPG